MEKSKAAQVSLPVLNRHNYNQYADQIPHRNDGYEYSSEEDRKKMVVEGEAYTIQELMERAKAGMPIPSSARTADYMEVDDVEKISRFYRNGLDLTDIDEYAKSVSEFKESVDKAIEDARRAQQEELEAKRESPAEPGEEPASESSSSETKNEA